MLPYFRFAYSQGTNSELRIAFASHVVFIGGRGLETLHAAFGAHKVISITEPTANEARFLPGPGITNVEVKEIL